MKVRLTGDSELVSSYMQYCFVCNIAFTETAAHLFQCVSPAEGPNGIRLSGRHRSKRSCEFTRAISRMYVRAAISTVRASASFTGTTQAAAARELLVSFA